MRSLYFICLVCVLALSACSKTTVVLLPDDDGKVGAIELSSEEGVRSVSEAYGYTAVSGSAEPADIKTMDQEAVNKKFGKALEAEPRQPQSHLLQFLSDSVLMRARSTVTIPAIAKAILALDDPEVSVIGHTDSSGDAAYNMQLSNRRAQTVKKKLLKAGVPEELMTIYYYGENDPLIPTADGVIEPRNRRVEVFIR